MLVVGAGSAFSDLCRDALHRLLNGDSIGEAAVQARTAARTDDDPATWLGFVIYARPDAKFVRA
jgi:hypothetical protein